MGNSTLTKSFSIIPSQEAVNAFVSAAGNGDIQAVVEFIQKHGSFINAKDKNGTPALVSAAMYGQELVVKMLIDQGADPDAANSHRNTALMLASMDGSNDIVELLIKNGADINQKNNFGMVPLMLAAREGNRDMTELLLENGADRHRRDNDNLTAAVHAQHRGYLELTHFLEHWEEIKKQRLKEKELADDIADFSAALKRAIPATRPLGRKPKP